MHHCRYNQYMGGVDRCDQLRGSYSMEAAIKTGFWYKKAFLGIYGIGVSNAYICWRTGGARERKRQGHSAFMQELFESLVGSPREQNRAHVTPIPPSDQVRLQRDPPHFFERSTDGKDSKKLCVYCKATGAKHKTRLCCDQCKQPLCSPLERNCFKLYHSVIELPKPSRKSDRVKPVQARSPPSASVGPKRPVGRPRHRPLSDDEDAVERIDLTT
jgi:hypothetical protein